MKIVGEARNPPPSSTPIRGFSWGAEENEEGNEDIDAEVEEGDDEEDEYDKRVKEVHASGEFRERLDWAESNVCVLCCVFSFSRGQLLLFMNSSCTFPTFSSLLSHRSEEHTSELQSPC